MYSNNQIMFSNIKDKSRQWIRIPLTIGIFILIVLPPLGVVWFMGLGWFTFIKRLIRRKTIPANIATLFFGGIILSSTVALLTIRHIWGTYVFIPVPLLLLGYYGVYLYIFEEMKDRAVVWFHSFAVSIITGGLYIFFFSLIIKLFHIKVPAPYDLLTGRALLGSPPTPRLYGSCYNPNLAAYLLLMAIGFSLTYLLKALKEKAIVYIILLLIILILNWYAILDTGSRSAFIVMLILILLTLVKLNWKVAIGVMILVIIRLQWLISLIPRKGIIDLSYQNRLITWETSLKIFMTHPIFGVSPAGFSVFYHKITKGYVPPHAHDIFLAFLSEYGIVGELVFLLFAGVLTTYFVKMVSRFDLRSHFYSITFLLTLPIILMTGILDHPLYSPQIALPTVILIAFYHRYTQTFNPIERQ